MYSQLISCSTDKTLALWDVNSGERIRKFRGHQTFINSCDLARRGPQLMCSGSDDGTIKVVTCRGVLNVHVLYYTLDIFLYWPSVWYVHSRASPRLCFTAPKAWYKYLV